MFSKNVVESNYSLKNEEINPPFQTVARDIPDSYPITAAYGNDRCCGMQAYSGSNLLALSGDNVVLYPLNLILYNYRYKSKYILFCQLHRFHIN
jgi:hypothetical protein